MIWPCVFVLQISTNITRPEEQNRAQMRFWEICSIPLQLRKKQNLHHNDITAQSVTRPCRVSNRIEESNTSHSLSHHYAITYYFQTLHPLGDKSVLGPPVTRTTSPTLPGYSYPSTYIRRRDNKTTSRFVPNGPLCPFIHFGTKFVSSPFAAAA